MTGADPDALIAQLLADLEAEPQTAARLLAGLVNRAAARLHTLARAESSARKAQPDWPAWAQLQNASRALVLQASTCRDLAARLPATSAASATDASDTSAKYGDRDGDRDTDG